MKYEHMLVGFILKRPLYIKLLVDSSHTCDVVDTSYTVASAGSSNFVKARPAQPYVAVSFLVGVFVLFMYLTALEFSLYLCIHQFILIYTHKYTMHIFYIVYSLCTYILMYCIYIHMCTYYLRRNHLGALLKGCCASLKGY